MADSNPKRQRIIIVLVLILVAGIAVWYFTRPKPSDANAALEKEISDIQKMRDSLKQDIGRLEAHSQQLEDSIAQVRKHMAGVDSQLVVAKKQYANAKQTARAVTTVHTNFRKEVEYEEAHPAYRDGDTLINSLKTNLNK